MDSKKMVLMNLFAGRSGDVDIENSHMDMGNRKKRVGLMEGIAWKHIH